jgi:hypothetical protein
MVGDFLRCWKREKNIPPKIYIQGGKKKRINLQEKEVKNSYYTKENFKGKRILGDMFHPSIPLITLSKEKTKKKRN